MQMGRICVQTPLNGHLQTQLMGNATSLTEIINLGVQSRHLVDRVWDETIRLRYPDFTDVFVKSYTTARLKPLGWYCQVVGWI